MFLKNKKNCRVPGAGTRQNKFLKIKKNCRVPAVRHSAKSDGRWPPSRAGHLLPSGIAALGKAQFCREPGFTECLALGKATFAECFILPSAALGKILLCRVPL